MAPDSLYMCINKQIYIYIYIYICIFFLFMYLFFSCSPVFPPRLALALAVCLSLSLYLFPSRPSIFFFSALLWSGTLLSKNINNHHFCVFSLSIFPISLVSVLCYVLSVISLQAERNMSTQLFVSLSLSLSVCFYRTSA